MRFVKCSTGAVLLITILNQASCSPFLYNLPRAITTLATSASASASAPAALSSNIVDFRRKDQKAEQLQPEKRLIENQELEDDFDGAFNESNNEATPSLLQKKINKILNKFRLISSLSSAIHGNAESPAAMDDEELQKEIKEFEMELEEDKLGEGSSDTAAAPQTLQKVIYPHKTYGEPLRVTLEIREAPGNGTEVDGDNMEGEAKPEMGKLGQIGVFFAELFGSLVGLAYGAAAHFNNVAQGNTTPPAI